MLHLVQIIAAAPAPEDWGRLAGRLHPAVVHFPIALLVVALAAESFAALTRRGRPSRLALQCLAIGAIGAVVAAVFGWIGAAVEPPGRSQANTLLLHRWTGVVAAALACAALVFGVTARSGARLRARHGYRGALLAAATLVGVGGFFGGELVHGRGHLLAALRPAEPPPPPAPPPVVTDAATAAAPAPPASPVDETVFRTHVLPIFQARCVSCHGPDRRKGGLRVDTYEHLFDQDDAWAVVRAGDAAGSPLAQRIGLPADDPDRMPADGEPLRTQEIAVIVAWINGGAPAPSAPEHVAEPKAEPEPEPEPVPDPDVTDDRADARRDAALAVLTARGASAAAIAADADAIEVNFSVAPGPVTDADLALLGGLEPRLERLTLSRTAITDAGVAALASFPELRELRLDHTAVTDAGIETLTALKKLERLNLFRTEVTDTAILPLSALPALNRVYVGGTGVTETGIETLRTVRSTLEVVAGAATLPAP